MNTVATILTNWLFFLVAATPALLPITLKVEKLLQFFGGSDIEMKAATPSPEGCVIDTFVLFGGSNLVVPEDWKVKSEVVSILGGYSDKRLASLDYDPEKTLIIKGIVLFGGLELKSY